MVNQTVFLKFSPGVYRWVFFKVNDLRGRSNGGTLVLFVTPDHHSTLTECLVFRLRSESSLNHKRTTLVRLKNLSSSLVSFLQRLRLGHLLDGQGTLRGQKSEGPYGVGREAEEGGRGGRRRNV